jgi:hypothetical protein
MTLVIGRALRVEIDDEIDVEMMEEFDDISQPITNEMENEIKSAGFSIFVNENNHEWATYIYLPLCDTNDDKNGNCSVGADDVPEAEHYCMMCKLDNKERKKCAKCGTTNFSLRYALIAKKKILEQEMSPKDVKKVLETDINFVVEQKLKDLRQKYKLDGELGTYYFPKNENDEISPILSMQCKNDF